MKYIEHVWQEYLKLDSVLKKKEGTMEGTGN